RIRLSFIGTARAPAPINVEVFAIDPSNFVKRLRECPHVRLARRIGLSTVHEHTKPLHPLRLLRACRQRPRGRAADKRAELPAFHHSITSSAMASRVAGTVRRSIRAV